VITKLSREPSREPMLITASSPPEARPNIIIMPNCRIMPITPMKIASSR
jgi:hypothetical protein